MIFGLNNRGQFVGLYAVGFSEHRAFIGDLDGNFADIDIPGAISGRAFGINDIGQISGTFLDSATSRDLGFIASPLLPTSVSALVLSPSEIGGGLTARGTVQLVTPAGPEGAEVTLMTTVGASIPSSIVVAPGESEASFDIETLGVDESNTVTVKTERLGLRRLSRLSVHPLITSLKMSPSPVAGCLRSTGTITLREPAPTGGLEIDVSSESTTVTLPSRVKIKAGKNKGTFKANTSPVISTESVGITASYRGGERAGTLFVRPVGVKKVDLSPNPIVGGSTANGLVTLECPPAFGPITVTISSSGPSVAQPSSSVVIPEDVATAPFEVATAPVLQRTSSSIRATANGISKKRTLTIDPPK